MCLIMSELLVGTSLLSLGTYFYMQDNSCLSKDYEDKASKHIKNLLLVGQPIIFPHTVFVPGMF